ncbi:hypothetical protein MTO96_026620 [Rhipicephalus appendiculatus]
MRMRLMRYTYDVVYVPGRDLTVADALSRSPLPQTESTELEAEIQGYVRLVASSVPVTPPSLQLLAQEQAQDPSARRTLVQLAPVLSTDHYVLTIQVITSLSKSSQHTARHTGWDAFRDSRLHSAASNIEYLFDVDRPAAS